MGVTAPRICIAPTRQGLGRRHCCSTGAVCTQGSNTNLKRFSGNHGIRPMFSTQPVGPPPGSSTLHTHTPRHATSCDTRGCFIIQFARAHTYQGGGVRALQEAPQKLDNLSQAGFEGSQQRFPTPHPPTCTHMATGAIPTHCSKRLRLRNQELVLLHEGRSTHCLEVHSDFAVLLLPRTQDKTRRDRCTEAQTPHAASQSHE
jgi:hypothetical protein